MRFDDIWAVASEADRAAIMIVEQIIDEQLAYTADSWYDPEMMTIRRAAEIMEGALTHLYLTV